MIPKRIYLSVSQDAVLNTNQQQVKHAIIEAIRAAGMEPQVFLEHGQLDDAWSFQRASKIMSFCAGAIVLAFAQWESKGIEPRNERGLMAVEGNHFEGGLAIAHKIPLLVLREEGVLHRGVVATDGGIRIGQIPRGATAEWITKDTSFQKQFDSWKAQLAQRRDVFLGYCSSSTGTAKNLKRFLENLGARVLDWQTDFTPGRTILQQIEEAAARCSAGIFLFTQDDKLPDGDEAIMAAPRDNVVFEAGYFINAKGKERVLIVRQDGTKMPADLGGDIYAVLKEKSNIEPIEDMVRRFIEVL
jgi:predicted nucleotide-binding protein with TIR-like domain